MEQNMAQTDGYLMVVALDFGTTYSGYAFSMKTDFDTDPLKIDANVWASGNQSLSSLKTPTCLFLNKKKKCLAFGYKAEDMHADFVMDGKIDGHYYFHRFKMNLHNNKNIAKDMVLEDITGKRLPAVDVFRLFSQALVEDLLKMLKRQGTCVQMNDIRWVLTVPAIWTDVAKQFMRISAERAGIPKDKLVLELEPETASIFCQYLPTEKLQGTVPGFTMTEVGTRYMVVDIGGGTADITVHVKASNGRLKELYRATRNDYGGTSIDKMFFKMLESIVGENVVKVFKEKDPLGFLNLEREFEARKRMINAQTDGKINLTFPIVSLDTHCKEFHGKDFKSLLSSSSNSTTMQIYHDKLRIDADIVRELFKSTIDNILSLINEILSNNSTAGVSHILMVGGFSECQLVYDSMDKKFPAKRIIIPKEAGLSVMKGAVLFGHRPDFVQSRVMRFSYGVKTNVPFDERKYESRGYGFYDLYFY